MNKPREVAQILATLRLASHAAGNNSCSLIAAEVLLLVAGGVDCSRDLMEATGQPDRSQITRAIQSLEGRTVPQGDGGRTQPYRLLERRKHPHQAGHQLRLAPEGQALLRTVFPSLHIPNWT